MSKILHIGIDQTVSSSVHPLSVLGIDFPGPVFLEVASTANALSRPSDLLYTMHMYCYTLLP